MSPPELTFAEGTELPGGVSSDIRVVETPEGPIVIKRALDTLKVAAEWHSDPARAAIEVRALRVAGELLGAEHVPAVLWERPEEHLFAMTLVDPGLRNWKQDLLAGRLDLATAHEAGRLLGLLHAGSAGRADWQAMFADTTNFVELRVEPFFDRVAARLPELGAAIRAVVAEMGARRSALVHGDYSPKNMMADGARVVILDFEVAHWGDPAFDLAFCASHLLLKAMRRGAHGGALRSAVAGFLDGYAAANGTAPDDAHLVRLTACLMLARTDGASPVDYAADFNTDAVRAQARSLLLDPPASLRAMLLQEVN